MTRDTIFVPLGGGPGDEVSIKAAAALAPIYDADVDAVFYGRDDAALMMIAGDGFTGLGASALEGLRKGRAEAESKARELAKSVGVELQTTESARAYATARARLAALAVVESDAARGTGAMPDVFQSLLMEDGAPLFVPRGPVPPKCAAIAWDGSREAARALKAARPLLQHLERVVVMQSENHVDAKDIGFAEPSNAAEWIGKNGGKAEVRMLKRPLQSGRGLLDVAREEGADLLITGAFGHARLREAVFGGATRVFLDADAPSLLLAH